MNLCERALVVLAQWMSIQSYSDVGDMAQLGHVCTALYRRLAPCYVARLEHEAQIGQAQRFCEAFRNYTPLDNDGMKEWNNIWVRYTECLQCEQPRYRACPCSFIVVPLKLSESIHWYFYNRGELAYWADGRVHLDYINK